MIKYYFICVLSFFLFFNLALAKNININNHKKIKKGVLDLRSVDFSKTPIVTLNGNWEFYWKKFYTSKDFLGKKIKPDTYIPVPSKWNKYTFNNKKFPRFGYATYRIKIIIPAKLKNQLLGIKIYDISSAYRLFINGKLKSSNGKISKSKKEAIPQFLTQITPVSLTNKNDKKEILFSLSREYAFNP